MCGRYFIDDDDYEIQQLLKELNDGQSGIKTGEIYPTDTVPVTRSDGVAALKWGFPLWSGNGVVINARAETALEKKLFQASVLERRCVVPSSGYYEWDHINGRAKKDKYLLKRPGAATLYMAGVWSKFQDANGEYEAFVILTTDSDESMTAPETEQSLFPDEHRPIHDRMPVILEPEECGEWLGSDSFARLVLQRSGPTLSLTRVAP